MCSIITCCGPCASPERVRECFDRSLSRGPDDTRFIDTGGGLMGFHRLAIMGLSPEGMQPFELEGSYAVCNGEIYGFEKFKEQLSGKYFFKSGSDCEVLLPLYREYGTEMFRLLDAEFACVIYDGSTGEYIAARDPIGIRPLYYGVGDNGAVLFASEPKDLVGLCREIRPFPPGHYYKGGEFVCYRDVSITTRTCHDDIDIVCKNIHDKLIVRCEGGLSSLRRPGFVPGLRHSPTL